MLKSFQDYHKISHCRDQYGKLIRGNSVKEIQAKYEALLQFHFAEEYNGNQIYCVDGRFVPYWNCHYYFNTLEECKARIDCKGIALMF